MFDSSTRSASVPGSPLAPGRSSAIVTLVSPLRGIHRTCTFLKKTMPVGPQYSSELGNTSGSINGLQVCPAPNCPNSPYACLKRNVVCPSSTPTPNSSNSKVVFSSPRLVCVELLAPKRVCRTPANVLWSWPYSPSNEGSLVTRMVSNQFG